MLNKLYAEFSPGLAECPKLLDDLTKYLTLLDRYFEDDHYDKISEAFLDSHEQLKYYVKEFSVWKEIVRLSVRIFFQYF